MYKTKVGANQKKSMLQQPGKILIEPWDSGKAATTETSQKSRWASESSWFEDHNNLIHYEKA